MTKYATHRTVTVAELAADLREILAEVRSGRTIMVTEGAEEIVVLAPPIRVPDLSARPEIANERHAAYGTREPVSSAPLSDSALSRLIGTAASRSVLGVFLRDPAISLHQREIARRADLGLRSAQIALARLVESGLLESQRDGNRLYYRANRSRRFEELRRLLAREMGVAGVIARHLEALSTPIERAFIFGSVAEGTDTMSSDVDLLVVGDVSADELVDPIAQAQRDLGREIDVVHYRVTEFAERLQAGNHFLKSILARERIDVIGSRVDP